MVLRTHCSLKATSVLKTALKERWAECTFQEPGGSEEPWAVFIQLAGQQELEMHPLAYLLQPHIYLKD